MNKKIKIALTALVVLIVAVFIFMKISQKSTEKKELAPVRAFRGDITVGVSTVGTVKPQNRLEIKPPITGRVEKILVVEGREVKVGDILALMSSTERATLIDAARLKGDAEYKYWLKAYKETPLIAPIDGVVIVRNVEPGQTVGTGDAVLVLSDRLIVEADVDETDIGLLKLGQNAVIGLDAYPEIKIDAVVDHISFESQIVNNVTIYKVDILPSEVPEVFRSGMSANVEVIIDEAKDVLMIPSEALTREEGKNTVMAKNAGGKDFKKTEIVTGLENGGFTEVRSGLDEGDTVLAPRSYYVVPKKKNETSPFMPQFKRKEKEDQPAK